MFIRRSGVAFAAMLPALIVLFLVSFTLGDEGYLSPQPVEEPSLCEHSSEGWGPPAIPMIEPEAPDAAPALADRLPGDQPPPEAQVELPAGHRLGTGVAMSELRVYAVNCDTAAAATDMLTLDEALQSGRCEVFETDVVNELRAVVTGARPVLALAGDLLLGGRQDRIVAHSIVLEPGQNAVPAFCVEAGRWASREGENERVFCKSDASAAVDLSVKGAALQGSQERVWSQVAATNRDVQAEDAQRTGSYRNAFAAPGSRSVGELAHTARVILSPVTVGFAVFRQGRFVSADLFNSTGLLQKVADKLLRTYAMTAMRSSEMLHASAPATLPCVETEFPTEINEDPDEINEDPDSKPNADLAANPNHDETSHESPHPSNGSTSAIGLSGGIGGGGGAFAYRAPRPTPQTGPTRRECKRSGSEKPVHIVIMGR